MPKIKLKDILPLLDCLLIDVENKTTGLVMYYYNIEPRRPIFNDCVVTSIRTKDEDEIYITVEENYE